MEAASPTTTEPVSNSADQGPTSEIVVHTVAEARGIDALELDPLYDVIDPDALNRLTNQTSEFVTVQFRYAGCEVTVHCDGEVVANPPVTETTTKPSSATTGMAD